jgi:transcriptional regulator with XRE-family HTH domain
MTKKEGEKMRKITPEEIKEGRKLKRQVGRRIKKARKALGLSYEELSKKTNLSVPRLIRFEKGEVRITILVLFKLADALRVKVSDLFPDE